MKKRAIAVFMTAVMVLGLAACGSDSEKDTDGKDKKAVEESKKENGNDTEIQVFIAASLNTVMTEIAEKYNKDNPDVKITFNADSSGTLDVYKRQAHERAPSIALRYFQINVF